MEALTRVFLLYLAIETYMLCSPKHELVRLLPPVVSRDTRIISCNLCAVYAYSFPKTKAIQLGYCTYCIL